MAHWWEHVDDHVTEIGFRLQRIVVRKSGIKATIIWLIFVVASFVHDFYPLPPSYLSNKKNILNVYFAKKGWGWTFGVLSIYVISTLVYTKANDVTVVTKTFLRLVYATLGWFLSTSAFLYVEDMTGSCEADMYSTSKHSCIAAKSRWIGFDISGHCFLSTYCILILNEEVSNFIYLKEQIILKERSSNNQDISIINKHLKKAENPILILIIDKISILMVFLIILWEFTLMLTCIYHHTVYQKLMGTVFGILVWYLLYHIGCNKNHFLAPIKPFKLTL